MRLDLDVVARHITLSGGNRWRMMTPSRAGPPQLVGASLPLEVPARAVGPVRSTVGGGLPAGSLMGTSNGSPTGCRRGRGSSRRDRRASRPAGSGRRPSRRTVQGTLPAPMTPPHCVARAATGYDMPLDRLLAQVTRTRWDRLPPEYRTVAADAGGSPGGPLLSGGDKRRRLGSKGQRPGAGCSSATTTAYSTARLDANPAETQ
jgi:hypothetical protein